MARKILILFVIIATIIGGCYLYLSNLAESADLTLTELVDLYIDENTPYLQEKIGVPEKIKISDYDKETGIISAFVLSLRSEFLKDNNEDTILFDFLKNFDYITLIQLDSSAHDRTVFMLALLNRPLDVIYNGKELYFNKNTMGLITTVSNEPFVLLQPKLLEKITFNKNFKLPLENYRLQWVSTIRTNDLLSVCLSRFLKP